MCWYGTAEEYEKAAAKQVKNVTGVRHATDRGKTENWHGTGGLSGVGGVAFLPRGWVRFLNSQGLPYGQRTR